MSNNGNGREVTGTGTGDVGSTIRRIIDTLYKPSAEDIQAKTTFYYRINGNSPFSGTPKKEWTRVFIAQVLGLKNFKISEEGLAWFKNEKSMEEVRNSTLELAYAALNKVLGDDESRAGDVLKAVDIAFKSNGVYEKASGKDAGNDKSGDISDDIKEAAKAAGLDLDMFIPKTVK